MKKLISIILTAILLASCLPLSLFTAAATDENDIAYIQIADVEVVEGTGGAMVTNHLTGEEYYNYWPEAYEIIIYFNDPSREPLICTPYELYDVLGLDIQYTFEEQTFENPWEVGTYEIQASVGNAHTTFNYTIVQNPVASILINDIVATEGTMGYLNTSGGEGNEYYHYWPYAKEVTVFFNDPDRAPLTCSVSDVYGIYGDEIRYLHEEQSAENPWEVGSHKITAHLGNISTTFNFIIEESPIASISIEDIEVMEGTNGYLAIDPETGSTYYHYWPQATEVTIYFRDPAREPVTCSLSEVSQITGNNLVFSFEQQTYSNSWGIGVHEIEARLGNITTTYSFIITESPIASIHIDDVTVMEGDSSRGYISSPGTPDEYFFYSNVTPYELTITFSDPDRESVTCSIWELSEVTGVESGYSYNSLEVQSPETPWGPGAHTITFAFGGCTTTYDFIIEESPIASVTAAPVSLALGSQGYERTEYDPELGSNVSYWFYSVYAREITVTFKDPSRAPITGTPEEIYDEIGAYPQTTSDQSCKNQWGLGTYTATVSLLGVSGEFEVTIIEDPIESIEVIFRQDKPYLTENEDLYSYPLTWGDYVDETYFEDGNEGFGGFGGPAWEHTEGYRYHVPQVIEKVILHFKDGVDADSFANDFIITTDQKDSNRWGVGTHTFTVEAHGYSQDFEVEVRAQENPIVSISVEDGIELLKNVDGEYYEWYETDEPPADIPFAYDVGSKDPMVTLTYKDSSTKTVAYSDLYRETGLYAYIVRGDSEDAPWGVGEHTATLHLGWFTDEFTVTVYSNGTTVSGSLAGYGAEGEVKVQLLNDAGEVVYETTTTDGSYCFDDVELGSYTLQVVKKGTNATKIPVNVDGDDVAVEDVKVSVLGDVDSDGGCSMMDLLAMRKYMLGMISEGDGFDKNAACTTDGTSVSMVDLLNLRKYMLGLITEFPFGS